MSRSEVDGLVMHGKRLSGEVAVVVGSSKVGNLVLSSSLGWRALVAWSVERLEVERPMHFRVTNV